ncbi:MAG: hypothetical protein B6U87_01665 [Candidatus Aenigmarchaeota archaeon ex4484_52]|nr:MAG: hypothetical protein B6U87_01665 [Candidatus Aenigmarchaeota archaeon ex4484_52]
MKYKIIAKNKRERNIIANARIEILFNLAKEAFKKKDISFAQNCVYNIINISRKFRISIKKYNCFFCKKCGTIYTPRTLKISINKKNHTINILCKKCKTIRRKPLI